MKRTIFCSILLGLILICSLTIPGERLSPCINSDDCGKVIGWIIDYDDGMVIRGKGDGPERRREGITNLDKQRFPPDR